MTNSAAKISDISAVSGVSVGNIYRYYRNKDEIFYGVIPEDFPSQILNVIRDKIGAAKIGHITDSGVFKDVTDTFIRFMLSNRKKILIVLAGSRGTKYERMRNELAASLLVAVKRFYPEQYDLFVRTYGNDDMLVLIYENLFGAYGVILGSDCGESEMISQIRQINLYHFSGITRLLNL